MADDKTSRRAFGRSPLPMYAFQDHWHHRVFLIATIFLFNALAALRGVATSWRCGCASATAKTGPGCLKACVVSPSQFERTATR